MMRKHQYKYNVLMRQNDKQKFIIITKFDEFSHVFIVTGSEKTDLMGIFAQIELLVPSECAFHCALIS